MNDEELIKIIGQNIKKYRLIYSQTKETMTIEKLSKLTNISQNKIYNLENLNINSDINITNLYKIATVLEVPINRFLEKHNDK